MGTLKRTPIMMCSLSGMLLGAVALAQAPSTEMDSHIATAKAAAGQDYRGTFVNLCLPAGAPGGGQGAARGAGGRGAAGAPQTPDRATWYAPPYKVFDNLYWLGTRQVLSFCS